MAKILIVEDDRIIAREMKKYMENWGYEAETIQNFKEILSEFAAFSPQLVLMDISLPFYSGYYWCEKIRQIPKVPIIFVSSASDNSNLMEHKGVIFNLSDLTVVYNGKKAELTKNESRILQQLLEKKGKIVSRDSLMMSLWETDSFVDDNTLSVNVKYVSPKMSRRQ
ncbi:MAG: DNA-binding response regulator [Blautia sp.]